MSAKEMFEELGFKFNEEKYHPGYYILYEREYAFDYTMFVSFFPHKEQWTVGIQKDNWATQEVERFDDYVLDAIIQQIKELKGE